MEKKGRNHFQEENRVTSKLKEFLFSSAIKLAISQECLDVRSTNLLPPTPNVMGHCGVTGTVKQCIRAYIFSEFSVGTSPNWGPR